MIFVSSEWLEKRLAKDGTSNHHKGEDDEWSAQPEVTSGQPAECGTERNHAPRDGSKCSVHPTKHAVWGDLLTQSGIDDGPQSIADSEQDEAGDSDITIRSESNTD